MTVEVFESLNVGDRVDKAGFFTKRHFLGDLSNGYELERRLGYAPLRLRRGWYVLSLLDRPPDRGELVFAGYTHFSGGRIRGHEKDPARRGETMEESLRSEGVNVDWLRADAAHRFTVVGPQRIVKVVPVLRDLDDAETSIRQGKYWHPSPQPIPQWILTAPRTFLVEAAFPGIG